MAIPFYLAQTSAEFAACGQPPEKMAWMACHFSPYGTGLSNLPAKLPKKSLLILNDRTPVHGHDPQRIRQTLETVIAELDCCGLLLDLQRPGQEETAKIVKALLDLPCPVAVSEMYAADLACPVFLPPVPLHIPVEKYLCPWLHRQVWLEASLGGSTVTVTEKGIFRESAPVFESIECPHAEPALHCHYRIELTDNAAGFQMRRTREDLRLLLEDAERLGICCAVGLYQEFYK